MSEQPGRYQRSARGMIGAMVVLLLVVGAFVLFRELNRNDLERSEGDVDYRQSVQFAEDDGAMDVLAPPRLPEGWRATSVEYRPEPEASWHLGLLTEDDQYVGVEQASSPAATMVERYVDADAQPGDPVRIEGPDGPSRWDSWTDSGGDYALVREQGGDTVLVVGTAAPDVIEDFTGTLR